MKAHLYIRLARLARNAAQTAKLLLVQINSKTQASQLEMCILTYIVWDNARAPHFVRWKRPAPLGACGSLMLSWQQMALFSDY